MTTRKRALIVDDQEDLRDLISMTLEMEDFDIHEASNGEDALRLARELRPSIVFLDVMMPGAMDGYQVCEHIKKDDTLKDLVKIILLTARGQRADIERGVAAGCDAYLVKPFSPIELIDTANRLV